MASSVSEFDKPPRGRPKRAELPDVNINTGAQSINSERSRNKHQKTIESLKGIVGLTVGCFFETRKQSMTWMEHGVQISLKRHALLN